MCYRKVLIQACPDEVNRLQKVQLSLEKGQKSEYQNCSDFSQYLSWECDRPTPVKVTQLTDGLEGY